MEASVGAVTKEGRGRVERVAGEPVGLLAPGGHAATIVGGFAGAVEGEERVPDLLASLVA